MGRRRRNATRIPEGTWPVELFKSVVVNSPNGGSKTWVTWFRHGDFESKSFFHLSAEKLRPIIERHAAILGLSWEGDVVEFLKRSTYSDHHAIEGWEGFAEVKFKEDDPQRYTLRILADQGAIR